MGKENAFLAVLFSVAPVLGSCGGNTETVLVEYDSEPAAEARQSRGSPPDKLKLSDLLDLYYKVINPTSLNRQGNDVGTQYRTGIYYIVPYDKYGRRGLR